MRKFIYKYSIIDCNGNLKNRINLFLNNNEQTELFYKAIKEIKNIKYFVLSNTNIDKIILLLLIIFLYLLAFLVYFYFYIAAILSIIGYIYYTKVKYNKFEAFLREATIYKNNFNQQNQRVLGNYKLIICENIQRRCIILRSIDIQIVDCEGMPDNALIIGFNNYNNIASNTKNKRNHSNKNIFNTKIKYYYDIKSEIKLENMNLQLCKNRNNYFNVN